MTADLQIWRTQRRSGGAEPVGAAAELPPDIVTLAPRLAAPGLPPEVAGLLPNQDTGRTLLAAVAEGRIRPAEGSAPPALGLFLADPFLTVGRVADALAGAGLRWIAALPSVAQHDGDMAQQLADVGLDMVRECRRLAEFGSLGFATVAVAGDSAAAALAADAGCDAVLVLPRVGDFAAGFPSLRQRSSAARSVRTALETARWRGTLLSLADPMERRHEGLWPDAVDGVVCRPEPFASVR